MLPLPGSTAKTTFYNLLVPRWEYGIRSGQRKVGESDYAIFSPDP